MEVKDLLDIIFDLRSDVWLIWQILIPIHTALVGWLFSRKKEFEKNQKILISLGYSILVFLPIVISFVKIYKELILAVHDLNFYIAIKNLAFSKEGFINYIHDKNYNHHLAYALIVSCFMYASSLFLIWSESFWRLVGRRNKSERQI
jgi:hypothetical protein